MRRPYTLPGLATAVLCVAIVATMSETPRARRAGVRLHVVDLDSGVPIAHARIAAASTPPLQPILTDSQGDATLDVPDAGRTVGIGKAGYAFQSIKLQSGSDVIDVRLARGATIAGRLVDRLGAPVVGRLVRAILVNGAGERAAQAATNDLGDYRIGGLAEGTYRVAIAPQGAALAPVQEHVVTVRHGDDVGGIDFNGTSLNCDAVVTLSLTATPAPGLGNSGIDGRVVTGGGLPLPCVDVTAYRGSTVVVSTRTDLDGHYWLRFLRAGSYRLEFTRPGFMAIQWGQRQAGQPGRPVVIGPREQRRNVDVRMPRGGAITGTVLDEFLEPAENVTVRALELRGDDRPVAVGTATAVTDDRGRYRLFGLLPGRYFVGAAASTVPPDKRSGTGYAPVYYPGEVEIASARVVELEEETERPFVDFARGPVRVATVTGFAVNSRNDPVSDRVILVASQRSGAVIAETQGAGVTGPDGAFSIPNVPPGDYVVQATSKRDGEPPEFGMQYVTVYEDDPMPVRIKTGAGLTLQGRLIEEGSSLVDPRSFAVTAIPTDWDQTSVLAGVQTVTPADDGTVTLASVTGPRRFALTAAPSGWYLKAILLRGRDVTDAIAAFPLNGFGAIRDFDIVVSSKGAVIQGEATDGTSLATDFSVVLFSSNPDHWFHDSRFVKMVRGTGAGRFRIDGIADGDYFIAAVDALEGSASGAWQDRDYLNWLTISARRVRVREGDERSIALTVTHR